MKVALMQEPVKIQITDSESLLEHSKIMMLRSQHQDVLNGEVDAAQRAADQAEYLAQKAKLTLEAVTLEAEQAAARERQAVTDFFVKVRNSHPQIKTLQERYGRGVTFVFDSDGHDVWVIAIFSSDAPPILRDDEDFPGESYQSEPGGHEPSDADGDDDDCTR